MNNKKNNRKGFTIVELVIVIAVIAILATVLVPTFGTIIEKANKSKALSEAKNAYTEYLANFTYTGDAVPEEDFVIKSGKYYVAVIDGSVTGEATTEAAAKKAVMDDIKAENEGKTVTETWATEANEYGFYTVTYTATTPNA